MRSDTASSAAVANAVTSVTQASLGSDDFGWLFLFAKGGHDPTACLRYVKTHGLHCSSSRIPVVRGAGTDRVFRDLYSAKPELPYQPFSHRLYIASNAGLGHTRL